MTVQKPSEQLRDLLMGKVPWDDAPASIRSWARFEIYNGAKAVAALASPGERRNMLGVIPASIRPHVEAEAKRLYALNPHRKKD